MVEASKMEQNIQMDQLIRIPLLLAGPIPYYRVLFHNPNATIELHESFPKQTLRNRLLITGARTSMMLSIPVKKYPNGATTNKIEIDYNQNWPRYFEKALDTAYNKSPFYLHYKPQLTTIFQTEYVYLAELSSKLNQMIFNALSIPYEFKYSTQFERDFTGIDMLGVRFENLKHERYYQLFEEQRPFIFGLSILDALFMQGPACRMFLQ